jgi:centromere protein B
MISVNRNFILTRRRSPPKHPKLEEEMLSWLQELSDGGETITDAKIQKKALEIADELRKKYGTIGSEKGKDKDESFKASAGWIENFKRRHHVKGGIWHGRPKPEEPEFEDPQIAARESEVLHAVPDQQYLQHHHTQADFTNSMPFEVHPGDVDVVEELPKGVPGKDEAERAYHTLTHYLDSNVDTLEGLGYKPEHRQALHDMFHHVFFKTSARSS